MTSKTFHNSAYLPDKQENGHPTSFTDGSNVSFTKNGRCSVRTRMERGLLLLAVLLALVVIGLILGLVLEVGKEKETKENICETSDCAMAAARILESVDLSTEPCDDFYQFACGGWKRKNVIPEDKSSQTVFSLVRDDVQVIIKYLLEDENMYSGIESVQKAKDLYQSCIDVETIEAKNITVAIPFLESLGGWPVLGSKPGGNWDENEYDLATLLKKLRTYNNKAIVDVDVSPDVKDSENYVLYYDRPSFGLPGRLYYLNNDTKTADMREAYVTFGRSIAELFGAEASVAETAMREILALEIDLANITMTNEDRRDIERIYNKMTISDMDSNFTSPAGFNYLNYTQMVMGMPGVEIPINGSEPVVVRDLQYFQSLATVLNKYDKRIITNYLVWFIMKNRVTNMPTRFTDLVTEFNKVLYGTATARARWRSCTSYSTGTYGMAIGHMFVKETFDESAKAVALDMISNIREAFNNLLEELDWMDDSTKALAKDKAASMREWIGFPDDVLDVEELNKFYENTTANATEYFHNVLDNLKRFNIEGLKNLRKKFDKNVWTSAPSTVNAFYNPLLNAIMFPAGILQPPFYSRDQPKSMNFGGIGMVIGHEITHGFDDRGRQYDKEGNLAGWWEEEVITKFKEKAQCIVDQYSNYKMPGTDLNVNGINTQGENIADNGGLKQSFKAYRSWVDSQGTEEPRLPGINFTHNQLFFINFAQLWCNNLRTESVISAINTGVHSPGRFRVTGTLQNSHDFAKTFSCPQGKYMNPAKKCYVW